jgi:nucleoside-diphosphate-sugar epimerase
MVGQERAAMNETVLVTGATGFVGPAVCRALSDRGYRVAAAVRPGQAAPSGVQARIVGDIDGDTDWSHTLTGIDAVVHLAARAHKMNETDDDSLSLYARINRDGALNLAKACRAQGIRRFLFLSSIKVNGESTPPGGPPFTAADAPRPTDPYGLSKWQAEQGLAAIPDLDFTVIRPPLIYGPGAKGNIARIRALLKRRLPVPLGLAAGLRSMVGLANLADAVAFCLGDARTFGQTYLIKDCDVSVPDFFRAVGKAQGTPALLLPVPVVLLRFAAWVFGKRAALTCLTESLLVDDHPLRALGWVPSRTLEQGLTPEPGSTTDRRTA